MGRDFCNELGTTASTPSVSIFSYGITTIAYVTVTRDGHGKFVNVDYMAMRLGTALFSNRVLSCLAVIFIRFTRTMALCLLILI
ncbi:MAG: hypothetical protein A2030_08505 [Chloroflexi bacterium RBG_19FT_COMBO_50_10]|nr:MAG: hypothetical protein A2030_08505 [Chloroflexi bacterium RBG_19FT_COMBO_50_10]